MARPSSSIEIKRFPEGLKARREMLRRCENGRVQDLFLMMLTLSTASTRVKIVNDLLDEVKDSYSISNRRKKTCAVRCEKQISAAINCAKQIKKLL